MDRYWISREQLGQNKVAIPSEEEMKKYSEKIEEPKPPVDLMDKARICAEVVELRYKGLKVPEAEKVKAAARLMKMSIAELEAFRMRIQMEHKRQGK